LTSLWQSKVSPRRVSKLPSFERDHQDVERARRRHFPHRAPPPGVRSLSVASISPSSSSKGTRYAPIGGMTRKYRNHDLCGTRRISFGWK
jgi:hypothetical protein